MLTDMSRTIMQIYAAAVCFLAVGCIALAVGVFAYSLVGAVNPAITVNPWSALSPPDPTVTVSPQDEPRREALSLERALRSEVALARQALLRWGITAIIAVVLFLTHWRILRRENGRAA
jgi:hypothetical protein